MRVVLIAVMTSPLWAGFLAIAWQARKFARTAVNARTLPARNNHNPAAKH